VIQVFSTQPVFDSSTYKVDDDVVEALQGGAVRNGQEGDARPFTRLQNTGMKNFKMVSVHTAKGHASKGTHRFIA